MLMLITYGQKSSEAETVLQRQLLCDRLCCEVKPGFVVQLPYTLARSRAEGQGQGQNGEEGQGIVKQNLSAFCAA